MGPEKFTPPQSTIFESFSTSFSMLSQPQATIITGVISSLIGASVALLTVYLSRQSERKKRVAEQYDTVKIYANPMIHASESLAWRLKEILTFNGTYLLPDAPKNEFFAYKTESTTYRLAAVLGWIHAVKKERSYLSGLRIKHHSRVQNAINEFEKILADGGEIEVSIIDSLVDLFRVRPFTVEPLKKAKLGVEIEGAIFSLTPDSNKHAIPNLPIGKQQELIEKVMAIICKACGQASLPLAIIAEHLKTAVREISRRHHWIYRDWQNAIGVEMLEKIDGASRRFDILSFSDYTTKKVTSNWLDKVDNLFLDLDVSVDGRFDARVAQLKKLFCAAVEVIESLKELVKKEETILQSSISVLKSYKEELRRSNNA